MIAPGTVHRQSAAAPTDMVDCRDASPYVRTLVERTAGSMMVVLLAVALSGAVGASEERSFVPGEALHRNFGSLLETKGDPESRILAASGRSSDPADKLSTTFYRNSTRRISVKATVVTFGDGTWLVQELVGEFMTERGLAFTEGTVVAGEGATRRLETSRESAEATARVLAWPSGGNRIVQLDVTLRPGGRAAEIPTEIVDAYLAAYPSSLPADVEDTPKYHLAWMRNEMDRVLAYAKRDLVLARAALGNEQSDMPSAEQYRIEAVRMLRRAVALRQIVYGTGDPAAFDAQFQKAAIAAIGPDMTLDKEKLLAFTAGQLREIESWWEAHRDDG
jgi:hypothetical protein